jgi:hypothetical protein
MINKDPTQQYQKIIKQTLLWLLWFVTSFTGSSGTQNKLQLQFQKNAITSYK